MAKTIMISDKIYEKLSKLKSKINYSYSELLDELMEKKESSSNTERINMLKGKWVDSNEDITAEKEIRKAWKKWEKNYA